MARYLIPLAVFLVLVVFFWMGLSLDPRHVPSPLVDKPSPAFEVARLRDANQRFSDQDFKGKVSLFNVFASWCVACRQEHPFLMQLSRTGTIPIFGLNYKDERGDALSWLATHGDPYSAIAYDLDGRVGLDWGVYGVPETFLIDKKGIIRHKHVGPISPQVWAETIQPLIDKLQKEPS
ncbi:MAG: thiol:disulfide interchange protein [Gammaproteobacteria bacterium SG8_47]|nr:MAG: thiol:disulfide interchange protein [Gammaproteobacteria bacterium SG8_47]